MHLRWKTRRYSELNQQYCCLKVSWLDSNATFSALSSPMWRISRDSHRRSDKWSAVSILSQVTEKNFLPINVKNPNKRCSFSGKLKTLFFPICRFYKTSCTWKHLPLLPFQLMETYSCTLDIFYSNNSVKYHIGQYITKKWKRIV